MGASPRWQQSNPRSTHSPLASTSRRRPAPHDRSGPSVEWRVRMAVAGFAVLATIGFLQSRGQPSDERPVEVVGTHMTEPTSRIDSSAQVAIGPNLGVALTQDEQDLVSWARHRFALVGLELPDVEVAFHDDKEPCRGQTGYFRGGRDHRLVDVCVKDLGTYASHLQRQRTLVHELAHAWDHANLDSRRRAELLRTLDATDWYAPDQEWDERGVERFAETIVWGLYDQMRRPTLIDVPCRELHVDFISITSSSVPGPLESICGLTSDTGNGDSNVLAAPSDAPQWKQATQHPSPSSRGTLATAGCCWIRGRGEF